MEGRSSWTTEAYAADGSEELQQARKGKTKLDQGGRAKPLGPMGTGQAGMLAQESGQATGLWPREKSRVWDFQGRWCGSL